MDAIILICGLIIAQVFIVVGALKCFGRSDGRARQPPAEVEPSKALDFDDACGRFDGYLIDGDPGVTLDDIFRD